MMLNDAGMISAIKSLTKQIQLLNNIEADRNREIKRLSAILEDYVVEKRKYQTSTNLNDAIERLIHSNDSGIMPTFDTLIGEVNKNDSME